MNIVNIASKVTRRPRWNRQTTSGVNILQRLTFTGPDKRMKQMADDHWHTKASKWPMPVGRGTPLNTNEQQTKAPNSWLISFYVVGCERCERLEYTGSSCRDDKRSGLPFTMFTIH